MDASAFILLALVAILLAATVSLFAIAARMRQREQVARRLNGDHAAFAGPGDADDPETEGRQSAYWSVLASLPVAPELQRSLREAGYAGTRPRLIFAFINMALPAGVLIAGVFQVGVAGADTMAIFIIFILVALAFLLPRWVLRWLAARRRQALSEEIPVVIQLLLMLLGAGLSIEHALRILRAESGGDSGASLLPEFSRELGILLYRVDAGGSVADELKQLADSISVQELTDLAAVLRQVLRRGGDIRKSLTNLAELIEDRRYTRMQERAGVIAGKMSAVMILFMFPALVLFIAGPGFLAVLEGLSNAAT